MHLLAEQATRVQIPEPPYIILAQLNTGAITKPLKSITRTPTCINCSLSRFRTLTLKRCMSQSRIFVRLDKHFL